MKKDERFDLFFEDRLKELDKLAEESGITMHRVLYEFSYACQLENWFPRVSVVEGFGTYEEEERAKTQLFEERGKKLFFESCHGIDPKPYRVDFTLLPNMPGKKCPELTDLLPIIGMKAHKKTFVPREGEISLIYFWESSQEKAVKPLQSHQDLFDEYPEWLSKLRIIEVCSDENFEGGVSHIVYSHWTRVEHYWLASSARKDVWGMIPKKISSFYCLVDSFGEIILFGEYSWDKLKEKLENFMFGIPISEDYTESSSESSLYMLKKKDVDINKVKKNLQEFTKTYMTELDHMIYLHLEANFVHLHRKGRLEQYGTFTFRYNWFPKFTESNDRIFIGGKKMFGHIFEIVDMRSEKQLYKIELGTTCLICKNPLGECDQFRCTVCDPPKYFCMACYREAHIVKSIMELPHHHAVYFLSLIHISEPTRPLYISYAVFCLKKKKKKQKHIYKNRSTKQYIQKTQ
eukprot:TRINITY_DN10586_c0_g1_i1.p1 TRINITY_DN10586_c0_g1~~TRINITY_DN10586_c0_g1_i1.p1  ORF type:complete len:461 (+),score=74.69 TRINITY_DN10586_c0_g1_i1:16-1398(+)